MTECSSSVAGRMHGMNSAGQHPDETLSLTDGNAKLHLGARLNIPAGTLNADRMIVQEDRGIEDDVLIFQSDGKRTIKRIRLAVTLSSPSPAVDTSTSWSNYLEEIQEPEEQVRLLAIYDRFVRRTFPD